MLDHLVLSSSKIMCTLQKWMGKKSHTWLHKYHTVTDVLLVKYPSVHFMKVFDMNLAPYSTEHIVLFIIIAEMNKHTPTYSVLP